MIWPEVSFSDVAEVVTGNTPPKADPENYGPGVPWVKPPDLDGWEPITATAEELSDRGQSLARLLPEGTVMVCCIGSIGRVGIAGTTVATNQQINSLVFSPSVLPRFGYYYCIHIPERLRAAARNAVVPILNKSNFARLTMPLPAVSEQRRIVDILDQSFVARRQRRIADNKANRILSALFRKMFGDPATNSRGWETVSFSEAMQDCTSQSPKLQRKDYATSGRFAVIDQGQNFIAGYSDDETLVTQVEEPVIVFGDHTRIVKLVAFPFIVGADGAKVLVAKHGMRPGFLATLLQMSRIPNLGYSRHMRVVKEMTFMRPPVEMQETFCGHARSLSGLAANQSMSKTQLDKLFDVLLCRAFAGELTAKWREVNKAKLEAELEQQMAALGEASSDAPRRGRKRKAVS